MLALHVSKTVKTGAHRKSDSFFDKITVSTETETRARKIVAVTKMTPKPHSTLTKFIQKKIISTSNNKIVNVGHNFSHSTI